MIPKFPYIGYEEVCREVPETFPPQHQNRQPGFQYEMEPEPISENPCKKKKRLQGKAALITGGDSGIGRAVAYAFAEEGADIAVSYLCEELDAGETQNRIEKMGRKCILIPGDLSRRAHAEEVMNQVEDAFGKIDILVNNCAVQFIQNSILDITEEQLKFTFETNIFSFFYMTQAALPYLIEGSSIINTASITAYQGSRELIDYSATKGAIVAFTRSLSQSLVNQGIRVNAVAPGPVWTPLIPSSYSAKDVRTFGTDTSKVPMMRAGQPFEIAPCYVFLASDDSSYMTGQVLHPNGGVVIGS